MRSIRLLILIGTASVLHVNAPAQISPNEVQPSLAPTFDIVSVRPMREDGRTPAHITNSTHNGYFRAVNVNVKALMEVAYDIPDTRMSGGPAWLTAGKFFIEATADTEFDGRVAKLSSEEVKQLKRKMLVALLADRFKLVVHSETKEMPVYAMVIAKGGPKLGGSSPKDESIQRGDDRIEIRAGSDSLEILAYELSWRLGRPVLDRTGLRDKQALVLRWQGDEATTADSSAPSLLTAIREQLGLKLETARGRVPVLLIDHAERPTENQ